MWWIGMGMGVLHVRLRRRQARRSPEVRGGRRGGGVASQQGRVVAALMVLKRTPSINSNFVLSSGAIVWS